jgi:ABC-type transport system involved in cytochrome c biogenesis ATPase subunit
LSGQVIFLTAMFGAGTMSVSGKVTVLGSDLLRLIHGLCQCTRGTISGAMADKARAARKACDS